MANTDETQRSKLDLFDYPLIQCPAGPSICTDLFATVQALKQHQNRTKHGLDRGCGALSYNRDNPVHLSGISHRLMGNVFNGDMSECQSKHVPVVSILTNSINFLIPYSGRRHANS